MAVSHKVRDYCQSVLADESTREHRRRGRADAQRALGRVEVESEVDRVNAARLWRMVNAHAAGEGSNRSHGSSDGCTRRCFASALKNVGGAAMTPGALEAALAEDWLTQDGDGNDARWKLGGSAPAEGSK